MLTHIYGRMPASTCCGLYVPDVHYGIEDIVYDPKNAKHQSDICLSCREMFEAHVPHGTPVTKETSKSLKQGDVLYNRWKLTQDGNPVTTTVERVVRTRSKDPEHFRVFCIEGEVTKYNGDSWTTEHP